VSLFKIYEANAENLRDSKSCVKPRKNGVKSVKGMVLDIFWGKVKV